MVANLIWLTLIAEPCSTGCLLMFAHVCHELGAGSAKCWVMSRIREWSGHVNRQAGSWSKSDLVAFDWLAIIKVSSNFGRFKNNNHKPITRRYYYWIRIKFKICLFLHSIFLLTKRHYRFWNVKKKISIKNILK